MRESPAKCGRLDRSDRVLCNVKTLFRLLDVFFYLDLLKYFHVYVWEQHILEFLKKSFDEIFSKLLKRKIFKVFFFKKKGQPSQININSEISWLEKRSVLRSNNNTRSKATVVSH